MRSGSLQLGRVYKIRKVGSQEPDTEILGNMLEAIEAIVDVAAPDLLTLDQLSGAFQRFKVVLESSTQRRHERLQRRQAEDFDEDEAEALEVSLVPNASWAKARVD